MSQILQITLPNEENQYYKLRSFPIIIGRSTQSDITVAHSALSRKHAVIKTNGAGDLLIEDLMSSNGTFINKKQLLEGQQEIFTSFFPVYLGSEVELQLVSEEEVPIGARAKIAVIGSSSDHSPNDEPDTHLASKSESVSLELAKSRKIKTNSGRNKRAPLIVSNKPKNASNALSIIIFLIIFGIVLYLYLTGKIQV